MTTAHTSNGHQLVPLVMAPLEQRGAVSVLPQQQPAPRWWRDGDTVIRVLAAAVVLAVAAFAAIVSYSHIYGLGRHHGQDGTAARLLPLSVDGLIASASLFMLYAARNGIVLGRLSWPRVMLWLGIGATVAANVFYGLPFGLLAAVISAWPAVAFVGSVEMAVRFARDSRQDATCDSDSDTTGDGRARSGQPGKNGGDGTGLAGSRPVKVAAVTAPPVAPVRDKLSVAEEAARDGVSPGAVRKRRERARKAAGDQPSPR